MNQLHDRHGKYIAWVIIIIALGVLWYIFFFRVKPVEVINSTQQNTEPAVQTSVVRDPLDKVITETGEFYDISIHYPEFGILGVDNEIMKYVNNAQIEFKKSFAYGIDDDLKSSLFTGEARGSLNITFEIKKTKGITTAVFHGWEYTGGAHQNPFIFTIHIGDDGKLLDLNDVFTVPASTYLEILSKRAFAQFSEDYKEAFFSEGATSNPENWNLWYIQDGKLVILFTAYQVAPYVNGEPELSIPLSEMKDIIKPLFIE